MRRILPIIIMLIAALSVQAQTLHLPEDVFKSKLPAGAVYTEVPRGFVISLPEEYFFQGGEQKIRQSALQTLDLLAQILKTVPNMCEVEDHTLDNDLTCCGYGSDWELSMARAANIVNYLTGTGGVPETKLFSLGYGDFMPVKFRGRVLDKRVDFVIIDYEAGR